MKQSTLFINADDFCLSQNVNLAIIDLAKKKTITSTTVMVNNKTLFFEKEILKLNNIQIGLHLNLTTGIPVSQLQNIKSLVNKRGAFFKPFWLWLRFILGLTKKEDIFFEIKAQYQLLYKNVCISHVDSHKHIHAYPLLGEYILQCLLVLGVKKIRYPYPIFAKNSFYWLLKIFCKRKKWLKFAKKFQLSNGIISLEGIESFSELSKYLDSNYEIMAHPSIENEKSYLDKKKDYNLLLELEK